MSDTSGGTSPFGSFPGAGGFPQGGGIMENMWDMMKLNPFAAAAMPGGGGSPSLSMMSDMLAPLTNVEELDKRIKDMRAVEQWLKLNLNMLQSAIQALEVQRATLATLRAFGAFAQDSVDKARTASAGAAESAAASWPTPSQEVPREASKEASKDEEGAAATSQTGVNDPAFDPSGWWNVLQSQFNNLATLALSQAAQSAAASGAAASSTAAEGEGHDTAPRLEPSKITMMIHRGDVYRHEMPGPGGWGDPLEREPEAVLRDVRNEFVSLGAARDEYGVVVDTGNWTIDRDATAAQRESLRRARQWTSTPAVVRE